MTFAKKDAAQHIVGGIVYPADREDSQQDWAAKQEITNAMHHFMEAGPSFSVDHETTIDAKVLECFQAEEMTRKEGKDVPKGAWWLTLRINDTATWERIEKGELTGFSWEGLYLRDKGVPGPRRSS